MFLLRCNSDFTMRIVPTAEHNTANIYSHGKVYTLPWLSSARHRRSPHFCGVGAFMGIVAAVPMSLGVLPFWCDTMVSNIWGAAYFNFCLISGGSKFVKSRPPYACSPHSFHRRNLSGSPYRDNLIPIIWQFCSRTA